MNDLDRGETRDPGRPVLGPQVPRSGGRVLAWAGRVGLRLLGFGFDGSVPDVPRCVMVVAPHTSNWDFPVGLCAKLALRLDCAWVGKHTIFVGPFGTLLRRLGGIPVDRKAPRGAVEAVAAQFASREGLYLALSPEGTRRRVDRWKSGFHRIARAAGVPIAPVALDWRRRRLRFFPLFTPTDDYERDVAALRALFTADMARKPENF